MNTPLLRASLVALSVLAAGPVLAQTAEDATTTADGETTTTVVEGEDTATTVVDDQVEAGDAVALDAAAVTEDDDGPSWGWLGLLGLIGLAGLGGRRRDTVATVTTHPTTVTAHPTVTTHSTTPR